MCQSSGAWAEQHALTFLENNGLKLLNRNYQRKSGEIDLIMLDSSTVTFVEVKYRANTFFSDTVESINWKKCERIINTSLQYLQENETYKSCDCRFDVVLITGDRFKPSIEWIKNAFQA